jgi:hypothetical protein
LEVDLAADAQWTDAEAWANGKRRCIMVDFGELRPGGILKRRKRR